MGIKRNTVIAADEFGIKPARLQAAVRAEQEGEE